MEGERLRERDTEKEREGERYGEIERESDGERGREGERERNSVREGERERGSHVSFYWRVLASVHNGIHITCIPFHTTASTLRPPNNRRAALQKQPLCMSPN